MTDQHSVAAPPTTHAPSWLDRVDLTLIRDEVGTPVFLYDENRLVDNIERILGAAAAVGLADRVDLYVPFFPNSNPHVLRVLRELGVGLLLQLPGELDVATRHGFDRLIVSPGHVSDDEIALWSAKRLPTFLSSLGEVECALRLQAPSISARIDSLDSGKPGIKLAELNRLRGLLAAHGRDLDCFEVYCGSGNSPAQMVAAMETLLDIFVTYFPTARSVDFAGGHGFRYDAWDTEDKHFEWTGYFASLRRVLDRKGIPEHVRLMFEPARDVLADVGVLLLEVKRDPIDNPVHRLVVTDGSRMLMPSAQLRDRHYNVLSLDGDLRPMPVGDGRPAALRGRTILRNDYLLPGEVAVPDGLVAGCHAAILDVGAYCATQQMEFLNVPPPPEVLIDRQGTAHLVSHRGTDTDKWRNLCAEPRALTPRPVLTGRGVA